jgi:hypothetical protein
VNGMSLLKKIKQGKANYKLVEFPGTEEKVAIVALSSNESLQASLKAEEVIKEHNIEDEDLKSLEHQKQLAYKFIRDKDNRDKQIADSFEDFDNSIDNTEIQYFTVQYSLFINENSPFLNSVSEEQFDELKKTLEKIALSDLNGMSLIALRNFLLTLASNR